MKAKLIIFTAMTTVFLGNFGQSEEIEKRAEQGQLKDIKDQISYSIGVNIGRNINNSKITINYDHFLAGVKDGYANKLSLMTDEEISKTTTELQKEMAQRHLDEM